MHRGLAQAERACLEALRAPLAEQEEALLVEILRQRLADRDLRARLGDPRLERDFEEGERLYLRSLVACAPDAIFLAERRCLAGARRRLAPDAASLLRGAATHLAVLVPFVLDVAHRDPERAERLVATLGRLLLFDAELSLESPAAAVSVAVAEPEPTAEPAPAAQPSREPVHLRRRRILVVDDDPNYLNLMNMILEDENTVCSVATPEQAVAMGRFYQMDVAILDQVLSSSLTGIDVGRELMRSNPRLQCILVSGYADERTQAQASEAGFCRFLPKPFDVETLRGVVAAAGDASEHGAA